MSEARQEEQGRRLLTAVERIIEDTEDLIVRVETFRREAGEGVDEEATELAVARLLVRHYSNRSAMAGGVSALPALLPGAGTLLAALGGTLADMGLTLKFEVEMALSLTHLFGFDIRRDKERQLAFLLASVSTYEAKSGRNFFVDLAEAEGTAIWNYAPRQVAKALLSVMAKLVLVGTSKGIMKAVPFVGIVIGSSANKILTTRVGERCITELTHRRRMEPEEDAAGGDVVDADFRAEE